MQGDQPPRGSAPVDVSSVSPDVALRISESRYRRLFETARDGILLLNAETAQIEDVNPYLIEMLGYSHEEFLGKKLWEVGPFADIKQSKEMFAVLQDTGYVRYDDLPLRTRAGTQIAVEFVSNLYDCEGISVIQCNIRNISERVLLMATRASLETQLREAQKMAAIGTLAGGIAHDFNNIIAAIMGNVELALQDSSGNQAVAESLDEIRRAARRASDLVKQILSFSRRQPTELKPMALAPIIMESVRLLRSTLPARLTVEVHCDNDVPNVLADATQIEQVVLNLVTNAMQAMQAMHGNYGRIQIRLESVTLDASLADKNSALRLMRTLHPGTTVRLTISDDGPGMGPATLERIFEPFFTTKPMGEGTGLGLAVVHGIMQVHGGVIDVESDSGKGTTFTIYLPEFRGDAATIEPPSQIIPAAAKPDTGLRLIYVDDEGALVSLVKRLLERRGYRVSGFVQAREALDALRANPGGFDLVLSDYNMPGMSGLEVAQEVRAIRANLPVALISGFIDETLRVQAGDAGVRELIFKTGVAEDLCEAIGRLTGEISKPSPNE